MTDPFDAAPLRRLLRLARVDAGERKMDLQDLERALHATQSALAAFEAPPDATLAPTPLALTPLAWGGPERRYQLRHRRAALETAIESARERLEQAVAEIAKLERAIAREEAARAARRDAAEVEALDAAGARLRETG